MQPGRSGKIMFVSLYMQWIPSWGAWPDLPAECNSYYYCTHLEPGTIHVCYYRSTTVLYQVHVMWVVVVVPLLTQCGRTSEVSSDAHSKFWHSNHGKEEKWTIFLHLWLRSNKILFWRARIRQVRHAMFVIFNSFYGSDVRTQLGHSIWAP